MSLNQELSVNTKNNMQKVYVLEVLKDGINEKHSYMLSAFTEKEKAIAYAEQHCSERGGIYSVAVLETELDKCYDALDLPKEVYRAKGRNDNEEYLKRWITNTYGLK